MTVVGDLEEFQSPLFYQDLDRGGPRIDRVLDKFLQRVHRRDDDFASGDLVDNELV